MHIRIEKKVLANALAGVQAAVERRTTIPILSNILLEADADGLRLTGTDLDMQILDRAPAEVIQAGSTTTSAAMLSDLVRKIPEGAEIELKLSADDPRLSVAAGRSKFNLPVLPPGDFPIYATADLPLSAITIKTKDLARLIDRTRFAMSTEETRYYLNGLFLHVVQEEGKNMLRAVATDGHRLALAAMATPEGAEELPGVIVPRKTVGIVLAALETAGETVSFRVNKSKIEFNFGSRVISSKLIDGTFPDYSRVIPKGNDKLAKVDADLLTAAVDRVATISGDKTRSTKLNFGPGLLTLSVRNAEAGAGLDEVEIDYDGEATEIGFNARYLMDVSRLVEGDWLEMHLKDSLSPILCRDSADPEGCFVLMPLRI